MTVSNLLNELSSADISEWMAFDLLKDEAYKEQAKIDSMSEEQKMILQKRMMGFDV